jgi:SAM-dependent methyltransferase
MSLLLPSRRPSLEALDCDDLSSEEMGKSLRDLAMVNRFWGSSRALAGRIAASAGGNGSDRPLILDVGAGAGEVSRRLAGRLTTRGLRPRVVALDLQWRHLAYGRRRSAGPRWAVTGDTFSLPFPDGAVDWAVSTLVFHHFAPEENVRILRELSRVARRGIAVLDVRRHPVALLAVSLAGRLFFRTRVSLLDGMASVRQAYTADEAERIAVEALPGASVRRVFPYALLISAAGRSPG